MFFNIHTYFANNNQIVISLFRCNNIFINIHRQNMKNILTFREAAV